MNTISGISTDTQKTLSGIISSYSDNTTTNTSDCDTLTVTTSIIDNGTLNVIGLSTLANLTITGILTIMASLITFTNITVSNLGTFFNITSTGLSSLFNLTVSGATNLLNTTCTALSATTLNISGNTTLQGTTCTNISSTGSATLQNTTCNALTTYGAINTPSITSSGGIVAPFFYANSPTGTSNLNGGLQVNNNANIGGSLTVPTIINSSINSGSNLFLLNNGATILPTATTTNTGLEIGWNNRSNGLCETDYINCSSVGAGGHNFYNANSLTVPTYLGGINSSGLTSAGIITGPSFNANNSTGLSNFWGLQANTINVSSTLATTTISASGIITAPSFQATNSTGTSNFWGIQTGNATISGTLTTANITASGAVIAPNFQASNSTLTSSFYNIFGASATLSNLSVGNNLTTVNLAVSNTTTFNGSHPTTTLPLPTLSNQYATVGYVSSVLSTSGIISNFTRFGTFSYTSNSAGATDICTFPIAQTTNISSWCLYNTNSTPNNYASYSTTLIAPTPPTTAQNQYGFSTIRINIQVMDALLSSCINTQFDTMIFFGRWNNPYWPPTDSVLKTNNCTFPTTISVAGNPNYYAYYLANNTIGTPGTSSNVFNSIGSYSRVFRQYYTSTSIADLGLLSFWGTLNSSDVGTFYMSITPPTVTTTGTLFYNISVELIGPSPVGLPATTLINNANNVSY